MGQVFTAHDWAGGPLMAMDVTRLGARLTQCQRAKPQKEQGVLDVILLAGGIGFFIISIAYAYGCDHL